ncbi:hypothetical protein LWI29_019667 [Acer saccharum]|uniref:RNase H type-1 domain-containing protein n=1 Tax=Acer saccharum TaxID=4024 RepID=A0AA39SP65_ACESA|nr:hypothetical protein LWI29_019667 [Acer saccharum]
MHETPRQTTSPASRAQAAVPNCSQSPTALTAPTAPPAPSSAPAQPALTPASTASAPSLPAPTLVAPAGAASVDSSTSSSIHTSALHPPPPAPAPITAPIGNHPMISARLAPSGRIKDVKWKPPEVGFWKINVHAATHYKDRSIGLGIIIRNGLGGVSAAKSTNLKAMYSPIIVEAMAVWHGLLLAFDHGLTPCRIELDSLQVVMFNRISEVISAASSRISAPQSSTVPYTEAGLPPEASSAHRFGFTNSGHKNNLRLSSSLQDFSVYRRLDPEEADLDLGIDRLYMVSMYIFSNWYQGGSKFYVVLDCGSTGTRVYVYQASVNRRRDGSLPIFLNPLTEGLSRKAGSQSGRAYDRMETEPGFDKLVHNISG